MFCSFPTSLFISFLRADSKPLCTMLSPRPSEVKDEHAFCQSLSESDSDSFTVFFAASSSDGAELDSSDDPLWLFIPLACCLASTVRPSSSVSSLYPFVWWWRDGSGDLLPVPTDKTDKTKVNSWMMKSDRMPNAAYLANVLALRSHC